MTPALQIFTDSITGPWHQRENDRAGVEISSLRQFTSVGISTGDGCVTRFTAAATGGVNKTFMEQWVG